MRPAAALSLLVGSALLFGLMAFFSKLASRVYDGATIAAVRFAIGAALTGGLALTRVVRLDIRRPKMLVLRGLLGGSAVLLYFLAIEHLSVGLASLLNYTSPLFTVFTARVFLGERMPRAVFGAMLVALLGVALVILGQPHGASQPVADPFWVAMGLLSAVLSAGAVTTIRAMRQGDRPETVWAIFFSFCVVGALSCAPFSKGFPTPSAGQAGLLLAIGLTAMAAQLAMNRVMRWVPATLFGISAQLAVVSSMVLGVVFLDEPWTLASAGGAALTLAGVAWAGRVTAAGGH